MLCILRGSPLFPPLCPLPACLPNLPVPVRPRIAIGKDVPPVVIGSAPARGGGGGGGGAAGKSPGGKRKGASASASGLGGDLTGAGSGAGADANGGAAADEEEHPDALGGGKTLGERVRAIAIAGDKKIPSSTAADAPTATDKAVAEALGGGKGAPPKADSLATLLSQALVAEDRALVERCLNVSDQTTISNTVAGPCTIYFFLSAKLYAVCL